MNDYETRALSKVNYSLTTNERLLEGAMGLCGETGEVVDIIKKYMWQGHSLNLQHLCEELGDILWYVVDTAEAVGLTLDMIQRKNIEKLDKRYPKGFNSELSQTRDSREKKI